MLKFGNEKSILKKPSETYYEKPSSLRASVKRGHGHVEAR